MDNKLLSPQPIEHAVWDDKYRYKPWNHENNNLDPSSENTVDDTLLRAVRGIYANDPSPDALQEAEDAVIARDVCPAGRELAGAGTEKRVTLVNCYVNATVEDSMATELRQNSLGIMEAQNVASYSLQMGGGIGTDFSPIRPKNAVVRRTHSISSGIRPFMDMWDAMSKTIVSSGSRRGAMMATLRCDHPDLPAYIVAKNEPGVLEQFNLSVLITDSFMDAVNNDLLWNLGFPIPRADNNHVEVLKRDGQPWYIYKRLPARELWNMITESTYHYAEPGVIFIDRINSLNNLYYCETISCTNPCGEQPLPPYGACVLAYINLPKMVINPFAKSAKIDYTRLEHAVRVGVRLLDNVIDETQYPVPEMEIESKNKRRVGLGVMGLGNMLQMMQVRYGSAEAVDLTEQIMRYICNSAYDYSIELAIERGPFPMFDADAFLKGQFVQKLPQHIQARIAEYGIRNGLLLTIAPTGTSALLFQVVSGGVEPVYALKHKRKMIRNDGSTEVFDIEDYGYRLYKKYCEENNIEFTSEELPSFMATTEDLTVRDHLVMQAICQTYIDSSISKTINCPESMTLEEFQEVYMQAYKLGCKSCTTYRPSPETKRVRGSILSKDEEKKEQIKPEDDLNTLLERPPILVGATYKIKWPASDHTYYVTMNDYVTSSGDRRPFEIFINTKDTKHQEWIAALTRSLSAIFRRGGDVRFVAEELKDVHSPLGGAWIDGKYVHSLVALIGMVVEEHFTTLGLIGPPPSERSVPVPQAVLAVSADRVCPKCQAPTLIHQEGCDTCLSCGFSNCS